MTIPRDPLATGGGGAVVEVLVGLVAIAAAALAALAVGRSPRDEQPPAEAERDEDQGAADD